MDGAVRKQRYATMRASAWCVGAVCRCIVYVEAAKAAPCANGSCARWPSFPSPLSSHNIIPTSQVTPIHSVAALIRSPPSTSSR